MPDLTALDTPDLLNEFDQYAQQQEVAAIIAELKARVIKENDSDDIAYNSVYAWRGAVRPKTRPLV